MNIEVLFFRGCPNHREAVERLRRVLLQENATAEIEEIEVSDSAAAAAIGFLGSPTIRVNGLDIEPGVQSDQAFGLACRTYMGAAGREGAPSVELIRRAVRKALPSPS
jgi:hypothetical protein